MKEVMPNPSHPISKTIKWGIKIKRFIERMKRRTRTVNRSLYFSWDM
jgi:hypothetical protein